MNVFAKIVAGEIPCYKVWEDDAHLAFLDVHPIQPGHTLVVPKREVGYLFDQTPEDYAALWDAVRTVSDLLQERLPCKRVCLVVAGWEVPHVHVHLIPTNSIDDFPPPPGGQAAAEELAALAARLTAPSP